VRREEKRKITMREGRRGEEDERLLAPDIVDAICLTST